MVAKVAGYSVHIQKRQEAEENVPMSSILMHGKSGPARRVPDWAASVTAAATAILGLAQDAEAAKFGGTCLLEVRGKQYMTGKCLIELGRGGDLAIWSRPGQPSYFAMVSVSDKVGEGYWNGSAGSTHAQDALGNLTRTGGCWQNATAKVCAWKGPREAEVKPSESKCPGSSAQIANVGQIIEAHEARNGDYPKTLTSLTTGPRPKLKAASILDGCGRQLHYRTDGKNFVLCALGSDGEIGTPDDVCYGRH